MLVKKYQQDHFNLLRSAFGGVEGRSGLPKIVDQFLNGKIKIDHIITHKMGLVDVNISFDLMHEGSSIRTVLKMCD